MIPNFIYIIVGFITVAALTAFTVVVTNWALLYYCHWERKDYEKMSAALEDQCLGVKLFGKIITPEFIREKTFWWIHQIIFYIYLIIMYFLFDGIMTYVILINFWNLLLWQFLLCSVSILFYGSVSFIILKLVTDLTDKMESKPATRLKPLYIWVVSFIDRRFPAFVKYGPAKSKPAKAEHQ